MSKGLTPLEALKKIGKLKVEGNRVVPERTTVSDYVYYSIIEKELKRFEELENRCSKAGITIDDYFKYLIEETIDNDKKLKAIEIIKEKRVDVDLLFRSHFLEVYNEEVYDYFYNRKLTQEEYDLLKEVLL